MCLSECRRVYSVYCENSVVKSVYSDNMCQCMKWDFLRTRKHICLYDFSYVGYHAYDYECVTECIKRDFFKNEETEETYMP